MENYLGQARTFILCENSHSKDCGCRAAKTSLKTTSGRGRLLGSTPNMSSVRPYDISDDVSMSDQSVNLQRHVSLHFKRIDRDSLCIINEFKETLFIL